MAVVLAGLVAVVLAGLVAVVLAGLGVVHRRRGRSAVVGIVSAVVGNIAPVEGRARVRSPAGHRRPGAVVGRARNGSPAGHRRSGAVVGRARDGSPASHRRSGAVVGIVSTVVGRARDGSSTRRRRRVRERSCRGRRGSVVPVAEERMTRHVDLAPFEHVPHLAVVFGAGVVADGGPASLAVPLAIEHRIALRLVHVLALASRLATVRAGPAVGEPIVMALDERSARSGRRFVRLRGLGRVIRVVVFSVVMVVEPVEEVDGVPRVGYPGGLGGFLGVAHRRRAGSGGARGDVSARDADGARRDRLVGFLGRRGGSQGLASDGAGADRGDSDATNHGTRADNSRAVPDALGGLPTKQRLRFGGLQVRHVGFKGKRLLLVGVSRDTSNRQESDENDLRRDLLQVETRQFVRGIPGERDPRDEEWQAEVRRVALGSFVPSYSTVKSTG